MIRERAGLSATDIDELIERLFENITLVPEADILLQYRTAAKATSPHPDADQQDTSKTATKTTSCSLRRRWRGTDIWSDDGVFKHRDYANRYRTEDIVEHSSVGP